MTVTASSKSVPNAASTMNLATLALDTFGIKFLAFSPFSPNESTSAAAVFVNMTGLTIVVTNFLPSFPPFLASSINVSSAPLWSINCFAKGVIFTSHLITKLRLGNDFPTPIADMYTTFVRSAAVVDSFKHWAMFLATCVKNVVPRSSNTPFLTGASVITTTSGVRGIVNAFRMSSMLAGVPCTRLRPGRDMTPDGLRTSAVMVWP